MTGHPLHRLLTGASQRPIFTLTANSGSLQKLDNSCTERIFSLHDFQRGRNLMHYTADLAHAANIDLYTVSGPVS
eukprot:COSAG05_NODE_1187_length_5585_cov_47.661502_3_plen_75_part_00